MKTYISIFAILVVSSMSAAAQGVIHLNAGDSYLFSQPTRDRFQVVESGGPVIDIHLGFTNDLFMAGDSLQVDIFSTPASLTPLLTSTASNPPFTYEYGITLVLPGVLWNAQNGAFRLTMLSGSVDVSSVKAITLYNFSESFYFYTIHEPDSSLLFLFSGAVLGGARWFARQKKRIG